MKASKGSLIGFFLIVILFPALLLPTVQSYIEEKTEAKPVFSSQEERRWILVSLGGRVREMELEQYVLGVVLAEMPADFESEALKAQAVVARTFAWKAKVTGGKHKDGSVCTNSRCCQGYLPEESYIRYYGTVEEADKVKRAVDSTLDMVITYEKELIEATYFSSSGGATEDAVAVWGNEYPYLVSKESPEPDNQGEESVAFSGAYLENLLHIELGDDPKDWFQDWEKTPGGGVAHVKIGGRSFSGTELRELLGLRSTVFSVTIENDVVFFQTKGYGHRVGMSQYGAEVMAVEGKSWEEILKYYYTGVTLETIGQFSHS